MRCSFFYFWWLWSSVASSSSAGIPRSSSSRGIPVGQADGIPHLFPFRAEGVGSADC
ncbi:MAG: hypothetical protein J6X58_02515 [Bacteroidales bacterium]|nr:hypothetical protein [Bacteroidales bacterium]